MDPTLALERARARDRRGFARDARFRCPDPVRAVGPLDPEYPPGLHLACLSPAPPALFVRGAAPLPPPAQSVAIIGSRRCTDEGRHLARLLAAGFASRGVAVVSGLALGIDAAAHEGALDAGGPTVAVLASAVDQPTPRANARLGEEIVQEGSWLVSERPPGARVTAAEFPRRNRLVVSLCAAVIVVQAGLPSGTLGTVGLALAADRAVGAVPGSILSPASAGANALIRAGATPITSIEDALALLQLARPSRAPDLDPREEHVLAGFPGSSGTLEDWVAGCGLPAEEARAALLRLLARGVLRRQGPGRLARCLG